MTAGVDDALVAELAAAQHLPRRALALALARPEAVAGPVLRVLETAGAGAELSDAEADLLFWGLHVLAHARDPRALAPLLALLRQDGETIDALLGDAVATTLSRMVASLFDGDPAPLFRLILDSTVDDLVRNALLAACAYLAHQGRIERQAVHAVLVRFDEARAAVEEALSWVGWEETIAVLGFGDLVPRVERARADGRLTDEFSDFGWFKDTLRRARARPDDPGLFPPPSYGTLDDPIAALDWTREGAGLPERTPYKDVGRNDPCPCGSGRKFKKCCLGKAADPDAALPAPGG